MRCEARSTEFRPIYGHLLLSFVLVVAIATIASAATFTVINTSDSGPGSLRQAMLDANANPGADTIAFNIPGEGVHTITPLSALPTLTGPTAVDGRTQPGYNGKPLIEISGANTIDKGIGFAAGPSGVYGLVVNGFTARGVDMDTSAGAEVSGCYIGTDATGQSERRNGGGVRVLQNATVTGNVIGGNTLDIWVDAPLGPTGNNTITNNHIGVSADGLVDFNRGNGIELQNDGNLIAGNTFGNSLVTRFSPRNNIIRDNVWVFSGNIILNGADTFGTFGGPSGNQILRNRGGSAGHSLTISLWGSNTGRANNNLIQENTVRGVTLLPTAGTGNRITRNAYVFQDAGGPSIGIGIQGGLPGDPLDADGGPNSGQNAPVISGVVPTADGAVVTGTLHSEPNKTYDVELYLSDYADIYGVRRRGGEYVKTITVLTDAAGNAGFTTALVASLMGERGQRYVTATATDPDGNTGPFALAYVPPRATTPGFYTFASVTDTAQLGVGALAAPSRLHNDGTVTFAARAVAASNFDQVYRSHASGVSLLFTAADVGKTAFSTPQASENGKVAFVSAESANALFRYDGPGAFVAITNPIPGRTIGVNTPLTEGGQTVFPTASPTDLRLGDGSGQPRILTEVLQPDVEAIRASPFIGDDGGITYGVRTSGGGQAYRLWRNGAISDIVSYPAKYFNSVPDQAAYNAAGTFVFPVETPSGVGIYTKSGDNVVAVATDATFTDTDFFGETPSINRGGLVGFTTIRTDNSSGQFVGRDGAIAKVIEVGDPLFGSTVVRITAPVGQRVNNRGQVAFYYELANGRRGIAVATPPAPRLAVNRVKSVTRAGGVITAVVELKNNSQGFAVETDLTGATLGATSATGTLPDPGIIAPNATADVTLTFPASAGAPGSLHFLQIKGTCVNANFSVSRRVTLP